MGFFKKKRTTTVENFHTTVVRHKIIKLTYLQTLSVVGGLGDIKELAGETESSTESVENQDVSTDNTVDDLADALGVSGVFGTNVFGNIAGAIGLKELFGKKVTRTVTATVEDQGWRVTKTWLQPEFDKIRYALGIRELNVAQFRYEKVSEVISQPWTSPKDITKVSLIADQFIPAQFPPGQDYIQYYVKPELPNQEWIRINPIGNRTVFDERGSIVPRIVNFNTERPATARLEDAYITTDSEVKQVRFRAVLNRPDTVSGGANADGYTPVLKSYRMLLHPRGGL
jgi:hypothetical protein